MPPIQAALMKQLYMRLHEKPLEAGAPEYEPIYSLHDGQDEPIDLLFRNIAWTEEESLQFFSGFRGSGKTTELFRLRAKLRDAGYFVVYADATHYINPAGKLDISDLLLTLAGAFSDELEEALGTDPKRESFWTRLGSFFTRTQLEFTEVGLGMDGVNIKGALKSNPTFRQLLQSKMAYHIGTLKQDVHKFFEDGVKAIRAARGEDKQIVFIFDSLEQIRGSISNEADVIHSVEVVFEQHLDKLRLPYVHAVFTVPPWLKFVLPGINSIVLLPSVQQWYNDPPRTPYQPGVDAMRRLLFRRIGEEHASALFANDAQVHRLIAMSGGHFRDQLRLLREALLRAKELPMTDAVVEKAVAAVRSNFLPIALDDATWLSAIANTRHPNHHSRADVDRLARFLDTHLVLFLDGAGEPQDDDQPAQEWYDIHPLIREEVERSARLAADSPSAGRS